VAKENVENARWKPESVQRQLYRDGFLTQREGVYKARSRWDDYNENRWAEAENRLRDIDGGVADKARGFLPPSFANAPQELVDKMFETP
jgi:hypothetical protein